MQSDSTLQTPTASIPIMNGVCFLYGYGVKVRVAGSHLVCEDGICEDRRQGRFNRATSGLKRLVICSTDGYISLDAVQWLHEIGAALVQIGDDGEVVLATAPSGCDYPHLRRAQALAAFTDTGLAITRQLLDAKLRGQAKVLVEMGKAAEAHPIENLATALSSIDEMDTLRSVEGQAADIYWREWSDLPLGFARKAADRIPDHWRTFGSRGSLIAKGPRNATNAANALLNYLYAILDGETRIGIITMGMDPGIGMLHTDQPSKNALVYDVMEPVRPDVDRLLYRFITSQVFGAKDFLEKTDGGVTLSMALRRKLSEQSNCIARMTAPHIEKVARMLNDAADGRKVVPTLLTQSNRSDGRATYRRNAKKSAASLLSADARCHGCGVKLDDPERMYCPTCLPEARDEITASFAAAGPSALAAARAAGEDPAHGGEAARKRGGTQRERAAARQAWEREHEGESFDPKTFRRDVLPSLQLVPLSAIMQATGLGLRYCSEIRRGLKMPHPMYWGALERCTDLDMSSRPRLDKA